MFEAFMTIMNRLIDCGDADCDFEDVENRDYYVTLNDFEGFDAHWGEVDREYADAEMVKALYQLLDTAEKEYLYHGWLCIYHFDDFSVELHCASEDI